MRSLAQIEKLLEGEAGVESASPDPAELLAIGEEILEHWLTAKEVEPTTGKTEGFRLLALHRQGAKLDPSFNACRESCRELVFHYNLITAEPDHPDTQKRLVLMLLVAKHLYYFVSGKMQNEKLGEFCCSSRDLRLADAS